MKRSLSIAFLMVMLAACTTPKPPRPAMQALSVAGDFGFSDRDIDADTIEVTYRGAAVRVSAQNPRSDSRVEAERSKVHDLALLRAARLAQERGSAALRIVAEKTDTDIDVQSYPQCRPSPFWGYPGFGYYGGYHGYHPGFGYAWPGYDCWNNRWAKARAVATLTVDLIDQQVPGDGSVTAADTIARLEKIYAGVTYP